MQSCGVLLATHSLHFRVHTRVLLTLLVALAATTLIWAEPTYRPLLREAGDAPRAADLPAAPLKFEQITPNERAPRFPAKDDLPTGVLHWTIPLSLFVGSFTPPAARDGAVLSLQL
ncbi:MAG: hypothetical protein Q8J74_05780 [Candidatus Didemnitutus sp.]|nr:hypothetical protein [Candidatus Didemnitutus sp.]